jgi:hypothetical protein
MFIGGIPVLALYRGDITNTDGTFFLLSGDMQTNGDTLLLSGDGDPGSLLVYAPGAVIVAAYLGTYKIFG